jgi:hypothetical protein
MSEKLQPMHTILSDEGFDFDLLEKINIMSASCDRGGFLASTFYAIPAMHGIANAIICYIKDVLFESGEIPAGTVANSVYGKVVTLGQQIGGDWSRPKEPLSTLRNTMATTVAAMPNNCSSAPANSCSGAVGSGPTATAEPIGRGHIGEHSPLGDGESHDVSNSTVAQPSAQRAFIDAFNDGLSEDEAVSRAIDLSTTADVN